MSGEDEDGGVERQEPELPRDGASAEDCVHAGDVDNEEGTSERDGDGRYEEEVALRTEKRIRAEDGRALFLGSKQITELRNDERNEEDRLTNTKEFL